jgi:hypothetical protein
MASATLEMFIKMVGVNKVASQLDKIEKGARDLDDQIKQSEKTNRKMSDSMSALRKTAIAGGAIFAGKALFDFSKSAVDAAVAADEAAAAFGTTFGSAAERATKFLEDFANKAGLTVGEAQQLTATLGAVAQGIGFTQEESADLSIELTKIAADVASFSNISAGAEPVLNAFRSALVGEREALKTYGIAITESEVQTRAFTLTGKQSADALNRQEKAFATLSLIQEKAAVQIGDLDRTLLSFANQSRLVGAELREVREEIGRELIPALEILLPQFRELVKDVTPSLISGFSAAAQAIIDLVLALDRFGDLDESVIFLIRNFSDLAEEQRFLNEVTSRTTDRTNLLRIQQGFLAAETAKARQQTLLQGVQFKTLDRILKKEAIPSLEKYLSFIEALTGDEEDLADQSDELAEAKTRVEEAQRKESLATAEERLQKKELQAQIQELLFFQEKGVDVSEELAVATEKLKLVEFELTRESEELREAKQNLNDIEKELQVNVEKATDKFIDQIQTYVDLNTQVNTFKELAADEKFMDIAKASGEANPFLAIGLGLMSELAAIQGLDERARELNNFAAAAERLSRAQTNIPTTTFTPADTPAIIPSSATEMADARLREIAQNIQVNVQIGEENIDDIVAQSNQRNEDRTGFFSDLVSRIQ